MLIQSQVALDLSDNAEEEGVLVGGQVSVISRTVSRMKRVMAHGRLSVLLHEAT